MTYLITGGSGSGKSEYAENLAVSLGEKRIYLATMYPWDEECRQRIQRHQKMRENKNFLTVECCLNLKGLAIPRADVVLLECLSNLAANELYMEGGAGEHTFAAVREGIAGLKRKARHLIVVTNEVFSSGSVQSHEMEAYLDTLGRINQELGRLFDHSIEVVYSIPLELGEGV